MDETSQRNDSISFGKPEAKMIKVTPSKIKKLLSGFTPEAQLILSGICLDLASIAELKFRPTTYTETPTAHKYWSKITLIEGFKVFVGRSEVYLVNVSYCNDGNHLIIQYNKAIPRDGSIKNWSYLKRVEIANGIVFDEAISVMKKHVQVRVDRYLQRRTKRLIAKHDDLVMGRLF
jgi:hypothetical protein